MNNRAWLPVLILFLFATLRSSALGVELLPKPDQLRTDRPRLLLWPKASPFAVSLKQLREGPHDKLYEEVLGRLKQSDAADAQAMVWLLTDDKSAAEKAVARMRAYRPKQGADSFEVFFKLSEFALAYDWLHDYPGFGPDVRKEVRENVSPLVKTGFAFAQDHIFHNYVWMSAGGIAVWGLAISGEDDAATATYTKIRERFERDLWPTLQYLDGLPSEPMGYWAQYVFKSALITVLAGQSAGESSLTDTIRTKQGNWLAKSLNTLSFNTLPDLRFIPVGDLQGGPHGGATRDMAGLIEAGLWAVTKDQKGADVPGDFGAPFALCKRIADVHRASRYRDGTEVHYMIYSRALQATPSAKTNAVAGPIALVEGDGKSGQWIARVGGWGDDSTVVGFRSTDHYGDHHHWDQGEFFIYHRGLLAVDPPVYKTTRGPQQRTDYHNTLLIGGQPQRPVRGQQSGTLEHFKNNLTAGKKLETGEFFTQPDNPLAAAGQYAQAYDVPELGSCVRQVAFLPPDTLVVVDRLQAKPGKQLPNVQWLLQFPAEPTKADGAWTATNGQAWIRCRSLLGTIGAEPAVEPTPMNTHRLTLDYRGGAEVALVHLVQIGDGKSPTGAMDPATARVEKGSVEVTTKGASVRFAGETPYLVMSQPKR